MSLRGILRLVKEHENVSRAVLARCIKAAAHDNAASRSAVPAFGEIAAESDASVTPAELPLAGLVVAASDCLDCQPFTTTYGVASMLIQRPVSEDHPLLAALRAQGAQFSASIRSTTPLSMQESAVVVGCSAARAVASGACHVAVVTSLIGAAGMPVAASGLCAFRPSVGSLPLGAVADALDAADADIADEPAADPDAGAATPNTDSATTPSTATLAATPDVETENRTAATTTTTTDAGAAPLALVQGRLGVAFVARTLDDVSCAWEALAAAAVDVRRDVCGAAVAPARIDAFRMPPSPAAAVALNGNNGNGNCGSNGGGCEGGPPLPSSVVVGIPEAWLLEAAAGAIADDDAAANAAGSDGDCDSAAAPNDGRGGSAPRPLTPAAFASALHAAAPWLRCVPLPQFDWPLERALASARLLAAARVAPLLAAGTVALEAVPQSLVSLAFDGRTADAARVRAAAADVAAFRRLAAEQFQEVDLVALPLLPPRWWRLSPGNARIGQLPLPFALAGHPMASLCLGSTRGGLSAAVVVASGDATATINNNSNISDNAESEGAIGDGIVGPWALPIVVVGQLGRDSGLLRDAEQIRRGSLRRAEAVAAALAAGAAPVPRAR